MSNPNVPPAADTSRPPKNSKPTPTPAIGDWPGMTTFGSFGPGVPSTTMPCTWAGCHFSGVRLWWIAALTPLTTTSNDPTVAAWLAMRVRRAVPGAVTVFVESWAVTPSGGGSTVSETESAKPSTLPTEMRKLTDPPGGSNRVAG